MKKALRLLAPLLAAAVLLMGLPLQASAAVTPRIITTVYPTEDVVIAEIDAVADYGADLTGAADSSDAIQAAIDACYHAGGGTVWLPVGEYLVTKSITVHSFVTLRGDTPPWIDDEDAGHGTVILARPPSIDAPTPALFNVMGSAGVMGLTVYYPEQSIENVKPYPFTFYINSGMLQNIINCTVINGYRGIGVCLGDMEGHEQMTIENFQGTFLHTGLEAYNQSDVGTLKNVFMSPCVWADAGRGYACDDPEALWAYTRANTTGLILGDLEWTQFFNIGIESCKTAIRVVEGRRWMFAGTFYNIFIDNCGTGIVVEDIDERWGMVVAKSSIHADTALDNQTKGLVKLCKVVIDGEVKGCYIRQTEPDEPFRRIEYFIEAPKPRAELSVVEGDNTGAVDCGPALQAALNQAGAAGGGVVYLPAGRWLLESNVTVPANVELRGTGTVAQRDQGPSAGTLIYAYPTLCATAGAADTATALVTLAGENAGVRGLRFVCPGSKILEGIEPSAYLIRGEAPGVYAVNLGILAPWNGIDFRGCDGHLIKHVTGCAFRNMFSVGGSGGMVEGCLQNGNAYYRGGFGFPGWPLDERQIWAELFDPITRPGAEYLRIIGAEGQTVLNIFAYGVKTLVVAEDSEDTLLVSIGADNLGGATPLLRMQGGSLTAVNMMRWNGHSYDYEGGDLRIYNRLTIEERREFDVRRPRAGLGRALDFLERVNIFGMWDWLLKMF